MIGTLNIQPNTDLFFSQSANLYVISWPITENFIQRSLLIQLIQLVVFRTNFLSSYLCIWIKHKINTKSDRSANNFNKHYITVNWGDFGQRGNFGKSFTVNWGDFGQRGNFGKSFNISVLSLLKELLDEMFLIVKQSHISIGNLLLTTLAYMLRENTSMITSICLPKIWILLQTSQGKHVMKHCYYFHVNIFS